MINKKDTLRLYVPFPNAQGVLAQSRHMYVCIKEDHGQYEFVKCQTLKQTMLVNSPVKNFVDEAPDRMRNPFENKTRIDCDKLFASKGVRYMDALKTTNRPNVCDDVFEKIVNKLNNPDIINMNEEELIRLNRPNIVKR